MRTIRAVIAIGAIGLMAGPAEARLSAIPMVGMGGKGMTIFVAGAILSAVMWGIRIAVTMRAASSLLRPARKTALAADDPAPPLDTGSFDQRVAARLAEMGGTPPVRTEPVPVAPAVPSATSAPAPRTFGRRTAS